MRPDDEKRTPIVLDISRLITSMLLYLLTLLAAMIAICFAASAVDHAWLQLFHVRIESRCFPESDYLVTNYHEYSE